MAWDWLNPLPWVWLKQGSEHYVEAALVVSLLSVWLLVGFFCYLNYYTKRDYLTIWTAAWLFYALWLTLGLQAQNAPLNSLMFMCRQSCVAISAVFLTWGSLRFLGVKVPQLLFGLFMLFLVVWTWASPQVTPSQLQIEIPVFLLLGMASVFAAVCFYRLRRRMPYVGAGMLAVGFFLWGVYLVSYPLSEKSKELYCAGFFVAAVLQLFIAVSMIVLVMEEVRYNAEQMRAEMAAVRSEKDALQVKILTTEEQCRTLYDQVRLTDGLQKAYEELRRTQQTVVQQERLRALGQMASGIAHDINNGLTPVVAYADLLLTTTSGLPPHAQQYLKRIRQAGEDIAHIVMRLREFYRRRTEAGQLTEVDVNALIQDVVVLTRPRWRDVPQREGISIQVQTELESNLPLLAADACDLREALTNLIFNAVDALPQGGVITLATAATTAPASDAAQPPKRFVRLEVRDNGIGMDEATRQRCLEPFFSTKAQRGGTGLGLPMVYGMMQRHEGTIEIESAPERGTCMRLLFPVRQAPQPVAAPPPRMINPDRSLSVLCIDDEPLIGELLQDSLSTLHHRVTIATGGRQGLELFRSALHSPQPFEAVITDLGMPEVDGHQVARAIKAESPKTPVIMLTGWGATMKAEGEITPSINALVGKPPRIQELNNLLVQLTADNPR